jgi:dihydroflavonol-4-reductase
MKVLITGATGFLGAHLCQRMVEDGHDVRVLSRRPAGPPTLDGLPVQRLVGDVTDSRSVRQAVDGREWVVHAAADLRYWGADPAWRTTVQRVNVDGAKHVAEACRVARVRRLVHVSSVAAIGIPTDPRPANEEFCFNLGDSALPYPLSKRWAEEEIAHEVARGLDAVIVNPAQILGPHGVSYRGADMLRKVRRMRVVPYFTTGGICLVHVLDVVEGIIAALERGTTGERYILGGENVSFRSLVERTASALNLRRIFVPLPPYVTWAAAAILEPWGRLRGRPPSVTWGTRYHTGSYRYYDSSKAGRVLGYAPRGFESIVSECIRLGAC